MKVQLRKLKIIESLSQETTCFSAEVWADDKKAGTVINRGNGGCNDYHWIDRETGEKLTEWAETQPTEYQFEKLDQIIYQQMKIAEIFNLFTRWCKKKSMFRLVGDKKEYWASINVKYDEKVKAFLIKKYGSKLECIMNEDIQDAAEKYA
jgi:hypothetical protein